MNIQNYSKKQLTEWIKDYKARACKPHSKLKKKELFDLCVSLGMGRPPVEEEREVEEKKRHSSIVDFMSEVKEREVKEREVKVQEPTTKRRGRKPKSPEEIKEKVKEDIKALKTKIKTIKKEIRELRKIFDKEQTPTKARALKKKIETRTKKQLKLMNELKELKKKL